MLTLLFILCLLAWLPIIFYQITYRGFFVLLIWLFIAPFVTNVVHIRSNPILPAIDKRSTTATTAPKEMRRSKDGYLKASHNNPFRRGQLYEPTRLLFCLFLCVHLLDYLRKKPPKRRYNRTEVWMGVFSLLLVASAFIQSYRYQFGLRVALDAFLVPFFAYYLARRYVTNEERLRQLVHTIGYIGLYLILLVLLERLLLTDQGLTYRVRGPFEHRDKLYIVMQTVFFMVLLSPARS